MGGDGEGVTETAQRQFVVARGPGLESDRAAVAESGERVRDGRVVDLARAGFAAARHVGDLDLADPGCRATHQLDQVPLADLRVIEVEIQPQRRAADPLDQGQRVGGTREGHTGVVDRGVEVLEHEGDARALAELGDPAECAPDGEPHGAGYLVDRLHRQAALAEAGAVQVQPWASQPLGHRDRLLRGA